MNALKFQITLICPPETKAGEVTIELYKAALALDVFPPVQVVMVTLMPSDEKPKGGE